MKAAASNAADMGLVASDALCANWRLAKIDMYPGKLN
jgi:hypothetical protein